MGANNRFIQSESFAAVFTTKQLLFGFSHPRLEAFPTNRGRGFPFHSLAN